MCSYDSDPAVVKARAKVRAAIERCKGIKGYMQMPPRRRGLNLSEDSARRTNRGLNGRQHEFNADSGRTHFAAGHIGVWANGRDMGDVHRQLD